VGLTYIEERFFASLRMTQKRGFSVACFSRAVSKSEETGFSRWLDDMSKRKWMAKAFRSRATRGTIETVPYKALRPALLV
jgi:hypothetical protein